MPHLAIDLNADLAEEAGDDAAILPHLSSANLCCGAHAGGPAALATALAACKAAGVTAGAHPGYPDRANFGRVVVPMTEGAIVAMVAGQVEAACLAAAGAGTRIVYVKPHGALYNLAATSAEVAGAIARGIAQVDRGLVLLGLAGSEMIAAGRQAGLATAAEAFADRAYAPDGTLVPRGQPGAVLHDPAAVAVRALAMVEERAVTASDGTRIPLRADSLCLHGDTPGALALARATRTALDAAGILVRPFA